MDTMRIYFFHSLQIQEKSNGYSFLTQKGYEQQYYDPIFFIVL